MTKIKKDTTKETYLSPKKTFYLKKKCLHKIEILDSIIKPKKEIKYV